MASWLSKLRALFRGSSTAEQVPAGHVEIDWTKWSAPGKDDVRCPCPAINALANHSILPHSGKNITKAMAVQALTKAYNLDSMSASLFSAVAVAANPDATAHAFDLDHLNKHNYIEHDVSLTRNDAAFGDNHSFSQENFDQVMKVYEANTSDSEVMTSWATAAKARYARVTASREKHEAAGKDWTYGLKEAVASYGETSLYLNLLGKDGIAPLRWLKIFMQEERLPYNEGWRPPSAINQSTINHGISELVKAHAGGYEEARLVGIGTFDALKNTILSLGMSMIKTPYHKT